MRCCPVWMASRWRNMQPTRTLRFCLCPAILRPASSWRRFNFPHLIKPFDLDVLVSEARAAMEAMRENIRRAQASAAEMRAHTERLAAAVEESRRLRAESRARRLSDR